MAAINDNAVKDLLASQLSGHRRVQNVLAPGDIGACIASQPDDQTTKLLWATNALLRVLAAPFVDQAGSGIIEHPGHAVRRGQYPWHTAQRKADDALRVDVSRTDGVDANELWAELAGHGARHLQHGGLGGVVGDPVVALDTHMPKYWAQQTEVEPHLVLNAAAHTGNEDDTTGRLEAAHLPACGLGSVQDTMTVNRHNL